MEHPQQQQQKQKPPHSVNRTLSVSSKSAVDTVGNLKTRFAQLEDSLKRTTQIVASETATTQDLLEAKTELAQIVGSLEKFQFNEVDAVETHSLNSGKDEVRQERKDLTQAVTALVEEATRVHREVTKLISAMSPPASSSGSR